MATCISLNGIINEEPPRWDVRVPTMGASHYSCARSLSNLLLLLLAIAAQVRARPLLAERLRTTMEEYGSSLRPLPLRHAASPPAIRPCKEMPATATKATNNDSYDDIMEATYSPPSPSPKVSPSTLQITCLNSPPSDDDLLISMVTDINFKAPSKSPPPPPKVSPPSKQVTDDLEAPSRSPPPAPKVAPPRRPGTNDDFEAPSRSPPPAPKVAPPRKPGTNDFEAPSRSPPPSPKVAPPRKPGTNDNFEAPSRSPPPPPKVAPPQKPGTNDFEAPSRSPPPPPKVAPPRKPGTEDFEAPSRSPPPPPSVSPSPQQVNNSERTHRSTLRSWNSLLSTHQLTNELGRLITSNAERSPPSAESYYSAY